MFHRGEVVELTITDYSFGGRGIAKVPTDDGFYVVFVDNSFPGQKIQARIEKKKKKYAEAKLIDILERSELEEMNSFQEISGGPYIYVPIHLQEKAKKETTLELFKRIGKILKFNNSVNPFQRIGNDIQKLPSIPFYETMSFHMGRRTHINFLVKI